MDFAMYLFYMGAMLTLGAAEGLMVSVVAYYVVDFLKRRLS